MQKTNDITETLNEIKKDSVSLAGWENLRIEGINKYGVEAVVKTDKGMMKIPMKDLFMQQNFRSKVFETFGIMVEKVKGNVYDQWLSEWAKTITDMGMEYGTSIEVVGDALVEYLESADDTDISYLKKGNPIILPDGVVAFKSIEFMIYIKKKYSMVYSEDQIRAVLKEIGCVPRRLGSQRIRVWTYKMPEVEPEGQIDIKFESAGRAPDVMSDENNEYGES